MFGSPNIWTLFWVVKDNILTSLLWIFCQISDKALWKNFNLLCFPLFGNEQRLDKKISSNEQYFHDFLLIIVKKIRCIFQAMTHTMTSHFLKAYPQGTFIWDFSLAKWVLIFSDGESLFWVHLISRYSLINMRQLQILFNQTKTWHRIVCWFSYVIIKVKCFVLICRTILWSHHARTSKFS